MLVLVQDFCAPLEKSAHKNLPSWNLGEWIHLNMHGHEGKHNVRETGAGLPSGTDAETSSRDDGSSQTPERRKQFRPHRGFMCAVEYGRWLDTGLVLSKDLGHEPYLDGTVSPGWKLWHSPSPPPPHVCCPWGGSPQALFVSTFLQPHRGSMASPVK